MEVRCSLVTRWEQAGAEGWLFVKWPRCALYTACTGFGSRVSLNNQQLQLNPYLVCLLTHMLLQDELRNFFNEIMRSACVLVSPGSGVLSCKITSDKGYAFLEMRSVEEASNAMALDGIQFKDTNLKVSAGGPCVLGYV